MKKEKPQLPQPSAQKKDPATPDEPKGQASEGDFEIGLDLTGLAPADPSAPAASAGGLAQGSPASQSMEVKKVLLKHPAAFEFGEVEVIAVQLAQSARGAVAGQVGFSKKGDVGNMAIDKEAKAEYLALESHRSAGEDIIEVEVSEIIDAEPMCLVDEKGNPMHVVIERGPGGKPMLRDIGSATPMPLATKEEVSATKTIDFCLRRIQDIEEILFPNANLNAESKMVIDEPSKSQVELSFREILKAVGLLRASEGISDYQRKILDEVEEMVVLFSEKDGGDLMAGALIREDTVNLRKGLNRLRWQLKIERMREHQASPSPLTRQGSSNKASSAFAKVDRETQEKIRKVIRPLLKDGKIREAKPILDELCNSAKAYPRLWNALVSEDIEKKNFMMEKEEPHPLVADFVENEASLERFRANNPTIRLIELGPGIGNDALYWIRNLPNLRQYYGIEVGKQAALVARERIAKVLREGQILNLKAGVIETDYVRKLLLVNQGHDPDIDWLSPMSTTIVSGISTLHYFWEENFKNLLLEIRNLLQTTTKGYFVGAFKTPDSDTWKDHIPILSSGGYNVGLHEREGIYRAFITPEKLNDMLDKAGFNMKNATSYRKVVQGYDVDSSCEVFWNVIAQPKDPKKEG